ncbi:hypothetical protein [Streptomyces zaomyceticus]|uniref:hypothetical protein n=1 Tax=Streptomyces zaomyceticus TaxID=68286 RepID=UPI0033AEE753
MTVASLTDLDVTDRRVETDEPVIGDYPDADGWAGSPPPFSPSPSADASNADRFGCSAD